MTSNHSVFVATIGGKPQVVTFALDCLLRKGVSIDQVIVFHYAPRRPGHRLHRALTLLQREFAGGRYGDRPCQLLPVPLRDRDGERLTDLTSEAAVDGAWQTLNETIGELKAQDRHLHLCLTGGRRLVGLLAMSVAALHFTTRDRLWHLYTDDGLRQAAGEGDILHAPVETETHLLEVPIMPGSETFPGLRQLLTASPREVLAARRVYLSEEDQTNCRKVWQALTDRQQEVLVRLARGLTPQEVAAELSVTSATISSHQNVIYGLCRVIWGLSEEMPLDYHWLERQFGRWPDLPSEIE